MHFTRSLFRRTLFYGTLNHHVIYFCAGATNCPTEDDAFLMETEKVRPAHILLQPMIESGLHVSQKTTFDRRIEAMIETEIVSFFEAIIHEAAKGEKTLVYQAVEKVVLGVVTQGAVKEVIHMNVADIAEVQGIVLHLTSNFIKIRH